MYFLVLGRGAFLSLSIDILNVSSRWSIAHSEPSMGFDESGRGRRPKILRANLMVLDGGDGYFGWDV